MRSSLIYNQMRISYGQERFLIAAFCSVAILTSLFFIRYLGKFSALSAQVHKKLPSLEWIHLGFIAVGLPITLWTGAKAYQIVVFIRKLPPKERPAKLPLPKEPSPPSPPPSSVPPSQNSSSSAEKPIKPKKKVRPFQPFPQNSPPFVRPQAKERVKPKTTFVPSSSTSTSSDPSNVIFGPKKTATKRPPKCSCSNPSRCDCSA